MTEKRREVKEPLGLRGCGPKTKNQTALPGSTVCAGRSASCKALAFHRAPCRRAGLPLPTRGSFRVPVQAPQAYQRAWSVGPGWPRPREELATNLSTKMKCIIELEEQAKLGLREGLLSAFFFFKIWLSVMGLCRRGALTVTEKPDSPPFTPLKS